MITIGRVRQFVREHRFAVALAASLVAFLIITQQVLMGGPMVSLDYWVHNRRIDLRHPEFFDPMYYLVMMGQRAPSAKLAYVIVIILAWRRRSWRPLLLLSTALFALNGFVGVLKLLTSRLRPAAGSADVFTHIGDIYPSGHASNVVVTWGIVAYILVRYGPLRTYRPGVVISSIATFIVGIASIYLDTHWVSDILAGWLAGAIILLVAVKIDLEYEALSSRLARWLRAVVEVDDLDPRRFTAVPASGAALSDAAVSGAVPGAAVAGAAVSGAAVPGAAVLGAGPDDGGVDDVPALASGDHRAPVRAAS